MTFKTIYSEKTVYKLTIQLEEFFRKNIRIFLIGNVLIFIGLILVGHFNDFFQQHPYKTARNYFFYFSMAFETVYLIYKPILIFYRVIIRKIRNKYPEVTLIYNDGVISFQTDESNLGLIFNKINKIYETKRTIEITAEKNICITVPKEIFLNDEWKMFEVTKK